MIREWQEAFILHQRPYGNTSVIAEVFTRNYGRVSVLARGAKNPKSKFFGYLTPFSKLKIMVSGRSDLKTLTHIERDNYHFSESLSTHSFSLLYVNEIMMQILPQQAIAAELFNLYENLMEQIHQSFQLDHILRAFELELLSILGYGINLKTEANSNQPIRASLRYDFVPEFGFKQMDNGNFTGQDIIAISKDDYGSINKELFKHLTQTALSFSLNAQLRSKKIFKSIGS